jgi:hypothetical protein
VVHHGPLDQVVHFRICHNNNNNNNNCKLLHFCLLVDAKAQLGEVTHGFKIKIIILKQRLLIPILFRHGAAAGIDHQDPLSTVTGVGLTNPPFPVPIHHHKHIR